MLKKMPIPTKDSVTLTFGGDSAITARVYRLWRRKSKHSLRRLKRAPNSNLAWNMWSLCSTLLEQLASPKALASPDFDAAVSGERKFALVTTDSLVDG